MIFASLTFLYLFLPICLVVYFLCRGIGAKNLALTACSLFFYAWGEPIWIVLILFSALADFFHGRLLDQWTSDRARSAVVLSSVTTNVGLLATFKYSGFIVANVNGLLGTSLSTPSLGLPLGISFYSFQTLSYTIDVYRRDVHAERKFSNFLLFVSLFPQLIAGPIVRYKDIQREIRERSHSLEQVSAGITRFCNGLFAKVILANGAGELVQLYMPQSGSPAGILDAWFGAFLFGLQIYFDFSGYSSMAIGLGMIFGFHYLENFNYPYVARSATEFWRRWHISLGNFFRDYVYIPLGGRRRSAIRNLFAVWFLTGLWHGAGWNFIAWGLYFGFFIYLERAFLHRVLARMPVATGHLYLLTIAMIGWVLFYFEDSAQLLSHLQTMFGLNDARLFSEELVLSVQRNYFWIFLAIVSCLPVYPIVTNHIHRATAARRLHPVFAQSILLLPNVLILGIATAMLVGRSYNPFIYFRF